MNWDDLRVLLEVHRSGSLLEAAKKLGVSTSTVARRLTLMEQTLGRTLIHRTVQGTSVDVSAFELLSLAEQLERGLATGQRDEKKSSPYAGVVRVSVPDGLTDVVTDAACRFQHQHPETIVEVATEQTFVDLASREADIGIRGGRSSSPSLLERPLITFHTSLYASREYVARMIPDRRVRAADYARLDFIVDDSGARGTGWSGWLVKAGATKFPFRANVLSARIVAGKRGLGVVAMSKHSEVLHHDLVRLETDITLPSLPFFVVMHRDLRRVPRIKGMADAIIETFKSFDDR